MNMNFPCISDKMKCGDWKRSEEVLKTKKVDYLELAAERAILDRIG